VYAQQVLKFRQDFSQGRPRLPELTTRAERQIEYLCSLHGDPGTCYPHATTEKDLVLGTPHRSLRAVMESSEHEIDSWGSNVVMPRNPTQKAPLWRGTSANSMCRSENAPELNTYTRFRREWAHILCIREGKGNTSPDRMFLLLSHSGLQKDRKEKGAVKLSCLSTKCGGR
jgi:hypothetical protein